MVNQIEKTRKEWRDAFQSEANGLPKLKPLRSFLEPLTVQLNYYIWNILCNVH